MLVVTGFLRDGEVAARREAILATPSRDNSVPVTREEDGLMVEPRTGRSEGIPRRYEQHRTCLGGAK
jgi:hypothetical protein